METCGTPSQPCQLGGINRTRTSVRRLSDPVRELDSCLADMDSDGGDGLSGVFVSDHAAPRSEPEIHRSRTQRHC